MMDSGASVELLRKENDPEPFHAELEFDYVIQGAVEVKIKDESMRLGREDIILVNPGVKHRMKFQKNAILCRVRYSAKVIAEIADSENLFFRCCTLDHEKGGYRELREICRQLVYLCVQRQHKTACMRISILYRLLDCLIENYWAEEDFDGVSYTDDMKMQKILGYVNGHFQDKVSLSELADQLYMAKSTLSRYFRQQTGIYFAEYLTQVRMRHAREELVHSDKNITRIAVDSGFSNPSVFTKSFREMYQCSPSEYREHGRAENKERQAQEEQDGAVIQKELRESHLLEQIGGISEEDSIEADVTRTVPLKKKWNEVLNIGSVYNLTGANLQFHTMTLKEHLDFQYGRVWSIFSKKLMLSDGKHMGFYNYDKIDGALDFLTAQHIIPFLDLGSRPDTALFTPGHPVFYEEDFIQFESKVHWEDALRDFILHIVNRYGKDEVEKWIFEFSCDSTNMQGNRYYQDQLYDYHEAFAYVWRTIKRIVPGARVGGPMGHSDLDERLVAEFLEYCREQGCGPDFVSFMLFPYSTKNMEEEVFSERATSSSFENDQIKIMRQIIEEHSDGNCRLFITEWNNTLSNRSFLNDSCFRASYMVRKFTELPDDVDIIGVWQASDWMSSYYDTTRIANGGSGLLTKDSIRKPAFFALQFLNALGDLKIAQNDCCIVTQRGKGDYYILCSNYKWYGCSYFIRKENENDPDEIENVFEDNTRRKLDITLLNLPSDTDYTVKRRTINRQNGSLLNEWKNFQYSRKLQGADVKYIRECCFPRMSMYQDSSRRGRLRIHIELEPHEITLLHIYQSE